MIIVQESKISSLDEENMGVWLLRRKKYFLEFFSIQYVVFPSNMNKIPIYENGSGLVSR